MKISELTDAVLIEPDTAADASIIWLHGLGADGNDFVPIVPYLGLAPESAIRFIFPHAEPRPVTVNGGMVMRAWYDIYSLDWNAFQDEDGIRASRGRIEQLIQDQIAGGIPAERILLAGFSQGGAITLHTALRLDAKLAGILALSTYLPLGSSLPDERSAANQSTLILMCHGEYDPVVPFDLGVISRDQLLELGYSVEWKAYPMGHEVCMEEITLIGQFIRRVLP
jgi:phospholipase/carboxylesterase